MGARYFKYVLFLLALIILALSLSYSETYLELQRARQKMEEANRILAQEMETADILIPRLVRFVNRYAEGAKGYGSFSWNSLHEIRKTPKLAEKIKLFQALEKRTLEIDKKLSSQKASVLDDECQIAFHSVEDCFERFDSALETFKKENACYGQYLQRFDMRFFWCHVMEVGRPYTDEELGEKAPAAANPEQKAKIQAQSAIQITSQPRRAQAKAQKDAKTGRKSKEEEITNRAFLEGFK